MASNRLMRPVGRRKGRNEKSLSSLGPFTYDIHNEGVRGFYFMSRCNKLHKFHIALIEENVEKKQEGNVLQEPAAAMNLMFSLNGLYNVGMKSVSKKSKILCYVVIS